MTTSTKTLGLTDEIDIPTNVNSGLRCPNSTFLESLLGQPRDSYSQECQVINNKSLSGLIKTMNVGPFTVTGLLPAVENLAILMGEIKQKHPSVYEKLGTVGMLCARYQRNSTTKISSHSWGTAIDLKLGGKLDTYGNKKCHYGLSLIAPIFNTHGWYWGAAFRKEDAMHFEVGIAKLEFWKKNGSLGAQKTPATKVLKRGDKGQTVCLLQMQLLSIGYSIKLDQDFGGRTETALKSFQKKYNIPETGMVDENTRILLDKYCLIKSIVV